MQTIKFMILSWDNEIMRETDSLEDVIEYLQEDFGISYNVEKYQIDNITVYEIKAKE